MQAASRIKILVAMQLNRRWDGLPDAVEMRFCGTSLAEIDAQMDPEVEILMTDAMPSALDRCQGLKWIQLTSANTSQLIGHPLVSRDILISNASGVTAAHAAEHILGCILDHTRRFQEFRQLQQKHAWADRLAMACISMRQIEVAILGYGAIGRETARLLRACGARIIAVTRTGKRSRFCGYMPHYSMGDPEATIPEKVIATSQLSTGIRTADFLVLTVPLNSSTEGQVDERLLSVMKKGAVLINVSRGPVVCSTALLQALNKGRIAHAYLDVFDQEPLPPDSPFWEHPAITVTPHIAGVMEDHGKMYRDLLLTNLSRYRNGEHLLNELDRTTFTKVPAKARVQLNK